MVQSIRMKKSEWAYSIYFTIMYLLVQTLADKEKRQIFREQVLPALGGKIPEEAFKTERLALNRLNKEGITIEDRHPRVKHHHQKHSSSKDILKVYVTQDNNYKQVDTTYIIRKPIEHGNNQQTNSHLNYKFNVFNNKPQIYSSHQEHNLQLLMKSKIHEPIIIQPSVHPATNNNYYQKSYYPSLTFLYDWDTFYKLLNDYYRNVAIINSQQKRQAEYYNDYTDYQEFQQPIIEEERPTILLKKKQEKQDFSKIPGEPWVDYPIFHVVPQTKFSCSHVPALPGMYANVETGCQAYHVCHDGREGDQGATFLCANGTIFNQQEFNCDWWYNVNCGEAPRFYDYNLDPEKNPYVPQAHKEAIRREKLKIVVV
ncbi:uncharacterized protein LOC127285642 [Leptopilina boulardi]|uniref:uncharacterized protein LOC127285642 n=1 Tax=Leptopilina boulardi TaxID=63433 RepID=UPI0021F558D4|nr:uncharacterized protein LOC127285642 [Leptopilina boulardi]